MIILLVIAGIVFLSSVFIAVYENEVMSVASGSFIAGVIVLLTMMFTSFSLPTGTVGVEENFGGRYTGKVYKEAGFHAFSFPVSHSMKKVDVRNDKTTVKVDVMKDETYNVHAKIEVVYDLEPDKLVKLLSNNPNYKSTVISAVVKQVVTSNNSLANSQTLNGAEQKEVAEKLDKYGIKVTNIYMDSYQLTNSNNYALNTNVNQGN
ncbi:hypothetical protein EFL81_10130 [Weissella confusa]|uniref:SPFH domain-containing protein n=1 Tax=Weissella confusa TaxID=1583 RepID=UPI00223C41C1|nr:SPFH domain-containing protein [Weissella confusa]MCS9997162.1 hypothetical protein [Weissella confusa]